MDKTAELKVHKGYGVKVAMDRLHAKSHEQAEKVADIRAQRTLDKVAEDAAYEASIAAINNSIKVLDEGGFKEAAAHLSKTAMDELDVAAAEAAPGEEAAPAEAAPAEAAPALPVEGEEAAATDEEAFGAAVEGAAEVLADLTGQPADAPAVQEAAIEIVQEAVNAAGDIPPEEAPAGETAPPAEVLAAPAETV